MEKLRTFFLYKSQSWSGFNEGTSPSSQTRSFTYLDIVTVYKQHFFPLSAKALITIYVDKKKRRPAQKKRSQQREIIPAPDWCPRYNKGHNNRDVRLLPYLWSGIQAVQRRYNSPWLHSLRGCSSGGMHIFHGPVPVQGGMHTFHGPVLVWARYNSPWSNSQRGCSSGGMHTFHGPDPVGGRYNSPWSHSHRQCSAGGMHTFHGQVLIQRRYSSPWSNSQRGCSSGGMHTFHGPVPVGGRYSSPWSHSHRQCSSGGMHTFHGPVQKDVSEVWSLR